jgi:ribosome-binding factor A
VADWIDMSNRKTSPRALRVADEIQRELAELLRLEVKDPRVGMVTVTHVEVTSDMAHAKVFVTNLGGKEHAAESVAALARTSGFLRSALAKRLTLYTVPQLSFVYDDSIESGLQLSQLIDQAVASDRRNEGK